MTFGPDFRLHRPTAPVAKLGFDVKMDKAVPQRPGHREVHTALRRRIPRCDYDPSVGQHVFAEPAVEYELVASRSRR
jgi:hypothetical protein